MDNPSTWDELYDKTKAARRRHWNFIGRKQGDNIEIFCAASTARLTRNRVGGIVECLCHAAGILRGHQVFATMSSDELKKLSMKSTFDSSVSNIYSHFLPCVLRVDEI